MPNLPTPPMNAQVRDTLYALWAWLSLLAAVVIGAMGVIPEWTVPDLLVAAFAALQLFGVYCGFLARNNISED